MHALCRFKEVTLQCMLPHTCVPHMPLTWYNSEIIFVDIFRQQACWQSVMLFTWCICVSVYDSCYWQLTECKQGRYLETGWSKLSMGQSNLAVWVWGVCSKPAVSSITEAAPGTGAVVIDSCFTGEVCSPVNSIWRDPANWSYSTDLSKHQDRCRGLYIRFWLDSSMYFISYAYYMSDDESVECIKL